MELFSRLVLHSLDGIVFGWLYALIAFGLSLIFGLLNIVNVAHGTLYMLGAVFGWYFGGTLSGGNYWVALICAPLIVCLFSVFLETVVLRPIEEDADMTILSTFGILLVVENIVLLWIGGQGVTFNAPFEAQIPIVGYRYSVYRLFVMGFAVTTSLLLWWFLQKTRYGLWIRAVRMNTELSLADGIPVKSVNTVAFALGGLLAGLSGGIGRTLCRRFSGDGVKRLDHRLHRSHRRRIGGPVRSCVGRNHPRRDGKPCVHLCGTHVGPCDRPAVRDDLFVLPSERTFWEGQIMALSVLPRADSRRTVYTLLGVLVILLVLPFMVDDFGVAFTMDILIWGLLAMSFDFIYGFTGLLSLGQSVFFGLGVYGLTLVVIHWEPASGWPC